MQAWKFLDASGGTVFSGFRWPRPSVVRRSGPWVESDGGVEPCRRGIHACRPTDLAWWINAELWEAELEGEIVEAEHKVVAARGRLVRRVRAWSKGGAPKELAAAAAWRTRDLAVSLLKAHGYRDHADRLANCRSLGQLEASGPVSVRQLGELTLPGRVAGLASDAAHHALAGAPQQAPFVSATAAGLAAAASARAGDEDAANRRAFVAERRQQSQWLANRLGLAVP